MYNLLFVESGTTGGGSFESLYQYLGEIDKSRFRPVVLFLNPNRYQDLVERMGLKVYLVHDLIYSSGSFLPLIFQKALIKISFGLARYCDVFSLFYLRLVHRGIGREIEKIILAEQIDLLYLNDQINRDMFGVFVAGKLGIPCISHLRSMDGKYFTRRKAAIANHIVSAYIANSLSTKEYWQGRGIEEGKSFLVYNAVKPLRKTESGSGLPNFRNDDHFYIGSIGRLVALKGYSFLLRAFKLFQERHPASKLILIGDGPLKGRLERETRQLGIADQVLLPGFIENARHLVSQFDLFVLPSRYDAFGRVLLEAMQHDVPVIGTDLYGIAEVIEHEVNGLLVPYNDDLVLCQAMERILLDEDLQKRFIKNGQAVVKEKFGMAEYCNKIESTIQRVLE